MTAAATPPVAAAFQIAACRRRVVARLIDDAVYVVLAAGINFVLTGTAFPSGPDLDAGSTDGDLVELAFSVVLAAAILTIYEALLTGSSSWNGQTIGKRLLGVRVASPDGTALHRGRAWRRATYVALLTMAPSFVGLLVDLVAGTTPTGSHAGDVSFALLAIPVIILSAMRGDRRRTLYDRWAATIVVEAAPTTRPALPAGSEPLEFSQSATAAQGVAGRPRTCATWWLLTASLGGCVLYAVALARGF